MAEEIVFHDLGLEDISDTIYDQGLIQNMKGYFLELLNYDFNIGDEHKEYFYDRELGKSVRFLDIDGDSEVGLFNLGNMQYILKRYWKYHKEYDGEYMKLETLINYYQVLSLCRQFFGITQPELKKFGLSGVKMNIVNDPYTLFETCNSYWTVMPYVTGKNHREEFHHDTKEYVRRMFILELYKFLGLDSLSTEIVSTNIKMDTVSCLTDIGAKIPRFMEDIKSIETLAHKLHEYRLAS